MLMPGTIDVLMAEDDPEDQMLLRTAFQESRVDARLNVVSDGEELLDYLQGRSSHGHCRRPDIILLDLNMPRKDGREALAEIKADPKLRAIPVVVLTTSSAEEDILHTYDLGISSYIRKPVTYERLLDVVRALRQYWTEIVELPPRRRLKRHDR